MTAESCHRIQVCLVSAANRLGTAACLLLVATGAAGEMHADQRYPLAAAFTVSQLGCACGYVAAVMGRGRSGGPGARGVARESRDVAIFNLIAFLAALAWMAVPLVAARGRN